MVDSVDKKPVFARRLAQARLRAGLTQTQLGLLAGLEPEVASPRINQYEQGKHEPRSETVRRLAKALNVPPAFLYTDDELLATILLKWPELSTSQRKTLSRFVEEMEAGTRQQAAGAQEPPERHL